MATSLIATKILHCKSLYLVPGASQLYYNSNSSPVDKIAIIISMVLLQFLPIFNFAICFYSPIILNFFLKVSAGLRRD